MTEQEICEKQRECGNTERVVDTTADYRELCQLRRELLDINLADDTLTLASLAATVRQLQIHSLSHLPLTAAVLK